MDGILIELLNLESFNRTILASQLEMVIINLIVLTCCFILGFQCVMLVPDAYRLTKHLREDKNA